MMTLWYCILIIKVGMPNGSYFQPEEFVLPFWILEKTKKVYFVLRNMKNSRLSLHNFGPKKGNCWNPGCHLAVIIIQFLLINQLTRRVYLHVPHQPHLVQGLVQPHVTSLDLQSHMLTSGFIFQISSARLWVYVLGLFFMRNAMNVE